MSTSPDITMDVTSNVTISPNLTLESLDANLKNLMFNTDSFFIIIMGILIFAMQVGFSFLEAGAVRTKNTVNILIKTMIDGLIGALAYWAIGWALAYGPGSNGFIGESNFFSYNMDHSKYPSWFFQFVFAATSSTIVSGSVAERCQFPAYIFYSFIITGCVYPPVSHWVWDSSSPGWLFERGFHDYAGSGVVHMTGGVAALVACIIIGPRKGRFNADGSLNDMPGHSVPLAGLGGGLLLVCFLAFNGGSQTSISKPGDPDVVGLAVINTVIGGSTCGVVVLFFYKFVLRQKWSYLMSLNGALTGMVCMCAGCNVYPIWASVAVATIAALVFLAIHYAMLHFGLDDPLDAVAVHCGGGTVGVLLVHFFSYGKGIFWMGHTSEPWQLLGINVAGAVCIAAWTAAWSFITFYPLNYFNLLRIKPQTEFKGLDQEFHGEAAYPVDAWVEIQYNDQSGDRQVPVVMQGSSNGAWQNIKRSQSYNLPDHIMPASAVIMKNSKTTFGNLPDPQRPQVGKYNIGFEDSNF